MQIENYINNKISIPIANKFAAILGFSPSKGARSPLLWNKAFEMHGSESKMIPLDVEEKNIGKVLELLDANVNFIGGAIAVPHKETIAKYLLSLDPKRLSPEARDIGAVNCLFRNNKGELCATNTDGEGATRSLKGIESKEAKIGRN